jgi:MFS family permease
VAPLRESAAFRRLWVGTTLSSVGGALTSFAVILQVYDLTRSTLAVGAIGVAQMVPTLAVGLLGGPLTDTADRRKLVLVTSGCLAAVSAVLAAQAFAGLRLVWLLYALLAVQSSLLAVDRPARSTFVPSLLPISQVAAGLALNRLSFQVTLTAGPALAGLIAASSHPGPAGLLPPGRGQLRGGSVRGGQAAGHAAAGQRTPAGAARGRRGNQLHPPQPGAGRRVPRRSQRHRLRPARGPFPAINAERFGGNPRTLGLFTAAIGVGGLASAAFSGPIRHIARQGRAMLCTVAVWGAAFAGFAGAPGLWLTLSLLAVAGAADTFTVVFRGAIVVAVTPDQLRGRVLAADYVVGAGGGELGSLEAGALGSLTSPTISALAGGLVTIAGAIAIGLTLPVFNRYRRQPDPHPVAGLHSVTPAKA